MSFYPNGQVAQNEGSGKSFRHFGAESDETGQSADAEQNRHGGGSQQHEGDAASWNGSWGHDGSWNGRSHGDDSTWGSWTRRSSWWSNSAQGGVSGWYETPQGWFWGESLDQAVQYGVARGWIQLDSAFCAWWHGHAESAVGKKHGNGEKEDSKSESDSRGESASGEQSGSAVTQKESFEKKHAGKEKVPEHDGELTMREYERRVRIFQATTNICPEFQAGRLLERLSGRAWRAAETLEVSKIKCEQGVEILLRHLWDELEPRVSESFPHFVVLVRHLPEVTRTGDDSV